MRCHSTSVSSGSAPVTIGRSALSITVAAISGGSSPWANASPQPVMPASVITSTSVAQRWRTQPWENANGSASALFRTWILSSVIFIGANRSPPWYRGPTPADSAALPNFSKGNLVSKTELSQAVVMAAVVATLVYFPLGIAVALFLPLLGITFDSLLTFGGAMHFVFGL